MTERLSVRREHRVLEVGTGSGYQAAVLSRLAGEVVSVERFRTLADAARDRLAGLGYDNVTVVVGDGLIGHPERAPYDRIIVTAAAERLPQTLMDQLAEGGVMLLPLGAHAGTQNIVKLTMQRGEVAREELIAVRFVPLLPGRAQEL
jgi:protein-L-isoaspartate(D-aspartate) O-methyltransferase